MSTFIHRRRYLIAGFSLVELIVVTVILGLLAAVTLPTFMAYLQRTRVARGVSTARMVQAALASFTTTSANTQYPASIGSYDELAVLINANGGRLKPTETEEGMVFQQYTALDADGDNIWENYTMSFRVLNVPTQRLGWCITIEPSGVTRCPPQ